MPCAAKAFFTRVVVSSSSRRLSQPQSVCPQIVFSSISGPLQMGKRLTREEIAKRRAKRAERNTINGNDAKEKSNALFIEGSTRFYRRHYVIVEAQNMDPNSWPAKLEQTPEHILSSYMGALAKFYGGDVIRAKKSPLLMTAAIPYTGMCNSVLQDEKTIESLAEGAHDILVFPEAVRIHNVIPSQISTLVTKSLEKDLDLLAMLKLEDLQYTRMEEGYHMMVCGHGARDQRCGCKGPELLQWLNDLGPDASKPLHLWISSHYGGHRYAASCIAYPTGDWFGLLNSKDKAKHMLDAVDGKDPLRAYELWRGRMGLAVQDMHQAVEERLNGIQEDPRS